MVKRSVGRSGYYAGLFGLAVAAIAIAGVLRFTPRFIPPLNAATATGLSSYLGIPAVVEHKNAGFFQPYSALRAGVRLRYVRNIFSTNQPDMMWFPADIGGRQILSWQTFDGADGLWGIFPGQEVQLVDDVLYDFGVGAPFVKIRRAGKPDGYLTLETVLGETEPVGGDLVVASDPDRFFANASIKVDGVRLFEQTVNHDRTEFARLIDLLSKPERYAAELSGGNQGGVHPLFAASTARGMLFTALGEDIPSEQKAAAVAAAETFVQSYVIGQKHEVAPGLFAWPYQFEWTINWGIKLSPPWYSAFANSQVLSVCALLYRLTGKDKYKALAEDAFKFIRTPIAQGGAEYEVAGLRLPAEYVYPTPPIPNVRVFDGELDTAIAIFDAARLLGNSDMLRISARYFASLSMQLDLYTAPDGDLRFSMYGGTMPDGYRWPMWAMLQAAGIISKDRRFTEAARRLTPFVGKAWCDQYGC
ncbi:MULTISPECIES: D-glucuronyl C5-epimerase family protein [Bradyrhizobium]|uniref:D-glucuronyl C5-epimerase family protein n=1 Tax=Bradyrhizobium TaxID=374 RepID=UPI001EDB1E95|nr:D-glucuronyl C5-epimerase family protein [Bradyrhizobium zhengyangense]MCG2643574.1 D-glucuronyl C5-epimerase family protein [Bradyrhizobium zhengyangense]